MGYDSGDLGYPSTLQFPFYEHLSIQLRKCLQSFSVL